MVQLKSNTEEGSTLSTLGAVLTLRPCNTFFFLGVHISHCQVQPSPFTIPKMSCCLDTLKCVLTYNAADNLYTLTISEPHCIKKPHYMLWFTNVSSLLLRCASLIPRPLPDYISQPWRKIGRRPGIKTMSRTGNGGLGQYKPSPRYVLTESTISGP